MIQIFLAGRDGTDGTDQPKVVQEVLADLKRSLDRISRCKKTSRDRMASAQEDHRP